MKDHNINEDHLQREGFLTKRVSTSEFHKSLGHLISPKEPRRIQMMQLKEVCDRFDGILQQNNLNVKAYEVLYRSVYAPTVKYILQGSSLNEKVLYDVAK